MEQNETYCPRCGYEKAEIIKRGNFFITDCKKCGFNMCNPR